MYWELFVSCIITGCVETHVAKLIYREWLTMRLLERDKERRFAVGYNEWEFCCLIIKCEVSPGSCGWGRVSLSEGVQCGPKSSAVVDYS